ncbi:MAG: methyltransferase domain-containing protein [Dehalococcoidia bacterium]
MAREVRKGMGKGAIYPHEKAKLLLHPVRRILQSPSRLADRLELSPGMLLLEVGPGPGWFSVEIARRLEPGPGPLLFDIQREMLRMATERLDRAGLSAPAVQGDAMALPFRDQSFDVALFVTVLGEVPDPALCLTEVWRVLKNGGLLYVSEARGDPDRIRYSRLREMTEGAGFIAEPGHPGRGWVYTAKFHKPDGSAPAGPG